MPASDFSIDVTGVAGQLVEIRTEYVTRGFSGYNFRLNACRFRKIHFEEASFPVSNLKNDRLLRARDDTPVEILE